MQPDTKELESPRRHLELISPNRELELIAEYFHRISRIIPESQELHHIPPNMLAREAISIMKTMGFSQLPVVEGKDVLGVFSFRSFSTKTALLSRDEINRHGCAPGELPVDEFLEQFDFASYTDDMNRVFSALDEDGGVLIGTHDKLQAILTPMDVLNYLNNVASPYVMISEIELSLRALIRLAISPEELMECAKKCLKNIYGENIPTVLEEMTFDNYRTLIAYGDNWPKFESVLGRNRNLVSGKLKGVCDLRNDVFHFKRTIGTEDIEKLSAHRDWFLGKARQADARRKNGRQI